MSNDYQFISMVDDLSVSRVVDLAGAAPRTLQVTGRGGFLSAQRVFVNDYGIDDFTVISDLELLVRLTSLFSSTPSSQMTVSVAAGELTNTNKVRLLFGSTRKTRKVSGLQKLVQQIVKMLLSAAGSNRFDPGEGGAVMAALGGSLETGAGPRLSADISRALANIEEQLISSQAAQQNLPSVERLLSLRLSGLTFNTEAQSVTAAIRLATFAGNSIVVPLIL
jgi:hypothetical protein